DAKTTERLRAVESVVQFADGRLLVNDVLAKRLLVYDRTLAGYAVTLDTTRPGPMSYPNTIAGARLFRYLGDSAVLSDMNAGTHTSATEFIVIGPDGAAARRMAHPKPFDVWAM